MSRLTKRRRHRTIVLPEVNLVPLIDTALTLLVIFMLTAPMMQQGIKVELPQGKAQEVKAQKEELVVYVDRYENIFFQDKKIKSDQLIEALKKQVTPQAQKTVFVKADRIVHYGKVIELVDRIKYVGGINYVALATTQVS
jgi:biopolymer transport protein TolR